MKIAIANDHAAVGAKNALAELLLSAGHEVLDLGAGDETSVDYPDFAHAVCRAVLDGEVERGILLCGTGIGMSIAANRHHGIRAALCHSEETARMSRHHNDANVLCLGARILSPVTQSACCRVFLEEEFEGGRHARRLAKIESVVEEA
ncbi:MAG: ribose 5-phosphate isomerase B [Planctomycetota bacterium]